jgi:hypothetical protein
MGAESTGISAPLPSTGCPKNECAYPPEGPEELSIVGLTIPVSIIHEWGVCDGGFDRALCGSTCAHPFEGT